VVAASEKEFLQNGAIMSVKSLGGDELEWYSARSTTASNI
jgi:hypothetical protein